MPRWQVAIIELEALLGIWLLSGWQATTARLSAIGVFALLMTASLYMALAEQPSCGCFGPIPVNPWLIFGVDLLTIMALFMWHAPNGSAGTGLSFAGTMIGPGAIVILVMVVGGICVVSKDALSSVVRLRGEALTLDPGIIEIGDGVAGAIRDLSIKITNHANTSIRLLGGSGKTIDIMQDMPLTLAAGESRSIRMSIVFVGANGIFQRNFLIYPDDFQHGPITGRIIGRVVPNQELQQAAASNVERPAVPPQRP